MAADIDPSSAIDPLITALNDHDTSVILAVINALGKIGHPAVRAYLPLIALLSEDDGHYGSDGNKVSWAVKMGLINLGRPLNNSIPTFIHLLKDPHSNIKIETSRALGMMAPATNFAIPNLIENLENEDADVRSATIEALGKFGPAAAIPVLVDLFQRALEKHAPSYWDNLVPRQKKLFLRLKNYS